MQIPNSKGHYSQIYIKTHRTVFQGLKLEGTYHFGTVWHQITTLIRWYYTWQSKEEGNISIFSHIAARMKGEDLTFRHEIMHNTEKTLLHFPGVLCAEDDHFPPSKIKVYASGGCHVVSITITRELSSIVYSEVRSTKILQLFRSGSDTPATHPVIQFSTKLIYHCTLFNHFPPAMYVLGMINLNSGLHIIHIVTMIRKLIWQGQDLWEGNNC